MEGYGTFEGANGDRFIGKYIDDLRHGYGIYRYADGEVYYGEWKRDKKYGQGYKRSKDGDEYWGGFQDDGKEWGVGVKQEKGLFYKVTYEKGVITSRSEYSMVDEIK